MTEEKKSKIILNPAVPLYWLRRFYQFQWKTFQIVTKNKKGGGGETETKKQTKIKQTKPKPHNLPWFLFLIKQK